MKKKLILPKFKDEDEERDFWEKIDLSEYYEPKDLMPVSFPNLKPSTQTISLRVATPLLVQIKQMADNRDVPYQSFMKVLLAQKVAEERAKEKSR